MMDTTSEHAAFISCTLVFVGLGLEIEWRRKKFWDEKLINVALHGMLLSGRRDEAQ